ncbi:TadE/TadG family type IV pilus assembly protein [Janibacter cremeus]|uniref:TadE/TadG family type IV pilus assembly protein n=1 Tax=Janibacter cremeus TaxID=1285192 RepID=UPI0023F680E8|nr:TadE/TadG family type IV pilus assembly protein [Janibacter cremeus]WEV76986.1 TadE/TadG family type IV pilus assembly protein [Janibacter cremeus]
MTSRRQDRGVAAVEFALVLPLLVVLVLGIAEFGRAYHVQTMLSAAARDGVRVMALQDSPTDARAVAKASASPLLTLTDGDIGVTPTTCATTTDMAQTATVTITQELSLMLFPEQLTVTLTGQGTMRCNG